MTKEACVRGHTNNYIIQSCRSGSRHGKAGQLRWKYGFAGVVRVEIRDILEGFVYNRPRTNLLSAVNSGIYGMFG